MKKALFLVLFVVTACGAILDFALRRRIRDQEAAYFARSHTERIGMISDTPIVYESWFLGGFHVGDPGCGKRITLTVYPESSEDGSIEVGPGSEKYLLEILQRRARCKGK